MKKFICASLIFLAVLSAIHGQNSKKVSLGGRFGMQIGIHKTHDDLTNWMKINNLEEEVRPNPALALMGSYNFTSHFGIQPELLFNFIQGPKAKHKTTETSYVDITYTSLDIPILLKVNFLPNEHRFGILAGPHVTFPLGKVKFDYNNFTNASEEKFDMNAGNFGFTAGLYGGYSFDVGRIIMDVRYLNDFTTSKAKIGNNVESGLMQRRGIIISLGIEFDI